MASPPHIGKKYMPQKLIATCISWASDYLLLRKEIGPPPFSFIYVTDQCNKIFILSFCNYLFVNDTHENADFLVFIFKELKGKFHLILITIRYVDSAYIWGTDPKSHVSLLHTYKLCGWKYFYNVLPFLYLLQKISYIFKSVQQKHLCSIQGL